jgi:CheY-like chemotaxis protein
VNKNNSTKGVVEVVTILVAEASTLIRLAICDYLRECKYRVFEAASGDEALTVLQADHMQVDVLFTEVDLPGVLDGFGLAKWVRSNRPTIKVLLAGTVDRAANVAADLCEDGPLLRKPYDH